MRNNVDNQKWHNLITEKLYIIDHTCENVNKTMDSVNEQKDGNQTFFDVNCSVSFFQEIHLGTLSTPTHVDNMKRTRFINDNNLYEILL
jgi:hypothetical protein